MIEFEQMTTRRLTGTDVLAGICVVLLVSATALALAANVHIVANRDLTVWGDRDLWRALTVGQDWPVSGPESNGGTPLPGGAFYLLLAAILAIQPSLWAAQLGVVVLMAGATVLLGWVFWREVSPLAGALVAAAFVGSGLLPSVLMVWNPGYLPFFAALSTVTAYFAFKTGRPVFVAATAAAIAVGMQIHLQMAWLLLAIAVAAVLRPRSWSWRHGAAFLVGFLVPYVPSLTLGGIRLFLQAAATPNDAIANYAIDDFRIWPKLDLELTLLGGDGGFGADRVPGTMPEALLLLAGDLAAVLLVLASLGGSLRRLFRRADAALSLIVLINIGVIACFYVYPRHVVVALPAVAVMTGLAGDSVVRRLLRSNSVLAKAGAA